MDRGPSLWLSSWVIKCVWDTHNTHRIRPSSFADAPSPSMHQWCPNGKRFPSRSSSRLWRHRWFVIVLLKGMLSVLFFHCRLLNIRRQHIPDKALEKGCLEYSRQNIEKTLSGISRQNIEKTLSGTFRMKSTTTFQTKHWKKVVWMVCFQQDPDNLWA